MRVYLQKVFDDKTLTTGEKTYVLDCHLGMGGSFIKALFYAIAHADESNLAKLASVYPDEVQGFLSWTRGDLALRVNKIIGEELK